MSISSKTSSPRGTSVTITVSSSVSESVTKQDLPVSGKIYCFIYHMSRRSILTVRDSLEVFVRETVIHYLSLKVDTVPLNDMVSDSGCVEEYKDIISEIDSSDRNSHRLFLSTGIQISDY